MIDIKYLAHSSVLIQCGATKLVFDPWLKGPAYHRQWFLWPLPVEDPAGIDADAILISHGHEDHLHAETLKAMQKNATVFFPFQWRAGIAAFLGHIGFTKIKEAVSFKTYHVNDVKVTYIGFSLESVVVIEYAGEVLVNINDALNSNHENAVDFMLAEISRRWPKITYLLSGWSGASYFPNQMRYPGKNDEEIGRLREQYFANNFCRFVQILRPQHAIPFASGFLLLKQENVWINYIKFSRHKAEAYYKTYYDKDTATSFHVFYPGDTIAGGRLTAVSALHRLSEDEQLEAAHTHYSQEATEVNKLVCVEERDINSLVEQLSYWTNFNRRLYHPKVIKDVFFSIKLSDSEHETYLNVRYNNKKLEVEKSPAPFEGRHVLITASAAKMLYGLKKMWGGDILTIGYGLLVDVYDELTLEKNMDIVCIRLVTRYPVARQDLLKFPLRALRFYTYNPKLTSLWIKQKVVLKPYINKYPYNERDHWISYNKCDLCAVCKMPEINLQAYS